MMPTVSEQNRAVFQVLSRNPNIHIGTRRVYFSRGRYLLCSQKWMSRIVGSYLNRLPNSTL